MRSPVALALVLVGGLLLAACGAADAASDPAWGRQPCARCGMPVEDARSAAQLVRDDGARLFFDDVGCMIAYERELGVQPPHAWVHDASGPAWIDAKKALYAADQATPMDFGYVAHADGAGASFDDVRRRVLGQLTVAHRDQGIP